jgi:hypothetical protein
MRKRVKDWFIALTNHEWIGMEGKKSTPSRHTGSSTTSTGTTVY